MKIGIISDTHGLLRPEATRLLSGAAHIIHAGDIGGDHVIEGLRAIAPITAIRGNNDSGRWAAAYLAEQSIELAGRAIFVLHDLKELQRDPAALGYDIVISGHSHRPKVETSDGVLYLNPGSAGPRRFKLPIAVAILDLDGDAVRPHIHEITDRQDR